MKQGRRPLFFAVTCVICLLLAPAAPAQYRWVNYAMGGLAALWAVLLALEVIAGRGRGERSAGL